MYRITLLAALLTFGYSDCNFDNWQELSPNLEGCDLSGQDLSGTDFSYMNLDSANLSGSNLSNCNFSSTSMVNADLLDVVVWNTNFTDALMCGVDISQLNLELGDPITEFDCFDVCGGSSELDECGVCDGDGTACFGCMDPFATNYSELAIYDDGSCEYFDGEIVNDPPPIFGDIMYLHHNNSNFTNDNFSSWNLDYSIGNENSTEMYSCVENLSSDGVVCFNGLYNIGLYLAEGGSCNTWEHTPSAYELDLSGNLVWYKDYGRWDDDLNLYCGAYWYATSLVRGDSSYYLTMRTTHSENKSSIVSIDENGDIIWKTKISTYPESDFNHDDRIYDGLLSNNGELVFVGYSETNDQGADATMWFLDQSGNIINNFTYNNSNWNNTDRLNDVFELSDGNYIASGRTFQNGHYYPILIKFNNNGIIFSSIIEEIQLTDAEIDISIIELDNGNFAIFGQTNTSYAYISILDQNGEFISAAIDHVNLSLYPSDGSSAFTDGIMSNAGEIILTGYVYNEFQGVDLFAIKLDQEMNIMWQFAYGEVFGQQDKGFSVTQLENNKLLFHGIGYNIFQNGSVPFTFITEYESGCTNSLGCNYNPIATYDNGSCYFEDLCGVCDGNDYDFCDDDGDGVNNYEQWGYGAYNLSLSDAPDDQGGNLLLSFDGSFYDTDTLQTRSELYTIEILENEQWYISQSFGAYGADSYNVIVPTLHNNQDTEVRVIANMDEGNFLSYETVIGQSLDNIAPGAPGTLLGEFESGEVTLSWDASLDSDFMNFNVYRQSQLYATTAESTFADSDLPNIPLLGYSVSAVDVNGNESILSDVDVLIYIDGDLNEDYELNVLDVVLMVEHIMGYELEDTEYADLNNDGAVDILDVVTLVGIILNENRS